MNLSTPRLTLRNWREEDLVPFAAMNADPRVMEHFPNPLTRDQSDALVLRMQSVLEAGGVDFLACEEKSSGKFIGFIGLCVPNFNAPFLPAVEVGWRLAFDSWGKGYAPEGAKRMLDLAFKDLQLDEVVSLTAKTNTRSIRVMEKIGMKRDVHGDFDHPKVPPGHPVRAHVLYRIASPLADK